MTRSSTARKKRLEREPRKACKNRPTEVVVSLAPDVYGALRLSPEEFAAEMRLAAAIHWYSQGTISQGKAAEIAGCSRAEFIEALWKRGIEVCQVTAKELQEEAKIAASHRR